MEFCPKRHAINFQNPAGEAFDDPGLGGTMLTNTTEIGTATLPRRRLTIPAPTDVSPSAPRRPPRFPALAWAALALLGLLAHPSPAAAQTDVWTATLTPADFGSGLLGCNNASATSKCSTATVLSDDDFTYDSTDYSVTTLYLNATAFTLTVDTDITAATNALTVVVGSTSLAFAAAIQDTARTRTWFNPGFSWTAGTAVSIRIPDTTPPELTSAAVAADGNSITVTFDESVDQTNLPAAGAFSVAADGAPVTVSGVSAGTAAQLVLALAAPGIRAGQVVTLGYTDPTDGDDTSAVQDTSGNDAVSFSDYSVTNNSIVVTVPSDWSLKPTGLAVGDQFRLLFLSSTKRDGSSTDIATYNTFIQTRAAAGHADIRTYSTGFRAVGCTADTDARDTTYTTYTSTDKGVPIYWLNGAKAADQYEDFYDGTWDDEVNDKNESGTNGPNTSLEANYPLTGCNDRGTEYFDRFNRSSALAKIEVMVGRPNSSAAASHGPLSSNTALDVSNTVTRPMYGLSAIFQVAADTTPPTLTSADVEITDALTINLVFSEDLQLSNRPAVSAFTVTVDGSAATVSSVLVPGSGLPQNELWLQLSTAIRQRQAVVVTYTDATSGDDTAAIQDTAGNDAATFTTGMDGVPAVTNNSTVTNTVPADWSLIPTGLSTGDKFRLLFLSSTKRTASSTDIADYNTFIQTRAAAGHTDIQDYSADFRAVGCTAAVDARDNTATTYTTTDKGVPIYWLNGAKAADQYEDFYDGSWDDEANDKNESGTNGPDTSLRANYPWTGCDHDGTEAVTGSDSFALGTNIADARVGRPNSSGSGHGPLNGQTNRSDFNNNPLYGLSAVFQVAAAVVVPNNPPTVATAIPDQSATAGTAFSYVFPDTTFSDADTSDTLTYTATKADDTALPTWLAFAAGTRTFSGTPTAAETVSVKVTASDGNGGSVSDTFDITVAADTTPPTLTSAGVNEAGLFILLGFSENLQLSNLPPASAFTVTAGGSAVTVSGVLPRPGAPDVFVITVSPAIRQGQAIVVTYTDPTAGDDATAFQDTAGNDAATFTTGLSGVPAVTNSSTVTNTPATGAPTITGTAQVGQTLTAGTTAIMDAEGLTSVSYTYQWIRVATDNTETNISGATASTYTLVAADLGTTVKVTVSFTDDASNAETLTSAATATVSAAANTLATGAPTITGTAQVGQTLTATVGTIADVDGLPNPFLTDANTSFQWVQVNLGTETNIASATASTYTLVREDWAASVRVKVAFQDAQGNSEGPLTSSSVIIVKPANTAATGKPGITGTAQVGQTLTATVGTSADVDGLPNPFLTDVNTSFQWIRVATDNTETNIASATASTYTLVDADLGTTIKVKVGFADYYDYDETLTSAATAAVAAAPMTPAHCNPSDPLELWCATLTVGFEPPAIYGYFDTANYSGTPGRKGSLSQLQFTYKGVTYTLDDLSIDTSSSSTENRGLFFGLSGLGETVFSNDARFTLRLGTMDVSLGDSGWEFEGMSMPRTDLSWANGDTVQVTLTRSNAAPTAADNTLTTTGDTQSTFDAGDFNFSDTADRDDTLESVKITALPTAGTLSVDGTAIASGDLPKAVSKADIDADKLTYIPASNANGSATFRFKVNDGYDDSALDYLMTVSATEVPATWSLIPTGLTAGDQFRLLFLSSTTRNGSSTDIADYNTFVQGRAAAGHADIRAYSTGFRAVGCTADTDARDNTETTYTGTAKGVAIYWLDGTKAADEYEDFYDGSWDDEANDKNESGTNGPDTSVSANRPITGCRHDGTEAFNFGNFSRALGATSVRLGQPNRSGSGDGPLSSDSATSLNSITRPMYGLSAVFQVAAAVVTTVPGAPTGLTAMASGTTAIDLSWSAPASTGGSAITGYRIEVSPNGTSGWTDQVANTNSTATTYAHTGLGGGTTRHYRVSAINTNGAGTASNVDSATSATTTTTVPGAPTGLTAMASGTTAIDLSWSAPASTGGSAITGYKIEVSTDGTSGWTDQVADTSSTATTYAHTGLTAGDTRHYRVSAINTNGTGTASNVDSATTGTTVPGAPTGLTAMASGTTAIDLSWSAPASTGGSAITGYKIESSSDGGSSWSDLVANTSNTTTTYAHTGLTAGTTRHYRVSAINTNGAGTASNVDSATTGTTVPGAPTGLTATASGTTAIDLSWSAPASTGGSAITGYKIEVSPNGTSGWTDQVANTNSTATTYAHTGLSAGDTRHYRVSAINTNGAGTASNVDSATTGTTVPGAPTGLTATASGTTAIDLSWSAPASTGGSAITGYKIESSSDGGSSWSDLVANTSNTTTTYAHTGLTAGATRHYRVSAINTNGTGTPSNVDSATTGTTVPGAPTGLTAMASGTTAIDLSWSAPASTGGSAITGYKIEVSPNGTSGWTDQVANTNSTATTYAHTGLTAGDTRHYRVSAINANGAGTASNVDSATTGQTTVTFGASSYTATEGGAAAAVTVSLSAAPSASVTIPLTTAHLNGATAADHAGIPATVTFGTNQTVMTFTVTATDDADTDGGESVQLGFGTLPSGYAPGARRTATVTLVDDDANLIVNFGTERHTTVKVLESDTVWHRFIFSLSTRSWGPPNGNPQQPVTIPLVVTHRGGATPADYEVRGRRTLTNVTFAVGESVTDFSMRAIPDGKREPGEGLRLDFGPLPPGVRAGTWGPYETIEFVDQVLPGYTVLFGAEAYTATEGGAPARVSIHLSEPVEIEPLVVRLVVTHVGATAADYTGIPKSVRFGVGEQTQTITVTATDDTDDDDGESVTLSFVNDPNGRVRVGTGPASATVALADNDGTRRVTVSFGAVTYTASEGGADATVRVELDAAPGRSVTVPLTKAHLGNATAADYSGIPMNVTFAANQTSRTFAVMATAGDGSDGGESVSIGFGTLPEGVFAGSPAATTVTLADGGEQRLVVNFGSSRGHTVQVREGARRLRLNVLLDSSPRRPVTIPLVVTHVGGATEADYAAIPESVTFAAGQTSAHYYVRALPDEEDETGEGLQLDFGPLPPGVRKGTWGPYETIDFLDPAPAANLPAFAAFRLLTSGNASAQDSVESDRAVLVALYNATDGPNWTGNTHWLSNEPLSEWRGVGVNDDGRVTALWLFGNQLTGEIPVELSQLSQLQLLYLSSNQLTGEIPVELSQLSQLQDLSLYNNQLTGEIPVELSQLSQLQLLYLDSNRLTGEIPAELGNLAQLNGLYLHGNELNGPIPSWLVNLTELRELSLWSNQLTGTIPPEGAPAQDRAALVVLYLQTDGPNWTDNTNWARSREPLSEWHGVSTDEQGRVEELRLSANGSNGTIGAELGVLTRLAGLYLNDNELTGTIPPELENLTQLQVFDIRNTGLCVTADSELHPWIATIQDFQGTATCGASNLVANFSNGNNGAFNSRVYLWNPSESSGDVTVRVFTLPLTGGLAQELTAAPLNLGTLGAKSALNVKVAEDILAPLGITLPYTNNEGDLTLEFTIQAVDVRGATQVFSSSLAFGAHPLQEIPSASSGSPTVLVANFVNGNSDAFSSRAYLFNPSDSDGNVTVRVFTLPLSEGAAQELTVTPLDLGTLEARSALNIKLAEDILTPLGITTPYTTDGGNLTLEFTIEVADVRGAAQVFSSSFAFGGYPLQEIPSTSSGSPTVLVANFVNGNSDAFSSRAYLFNPSDSDGNVTVRVFTLPLSDGTARELTGPPLDLGTLEARSALNIKLVEDILAPLGIALPYVTDGGNLTLEFTIQAADARGVAQVFSSDFAFGTYPMQEIPSTSSGNPTVLVANFMNGNDAALNSRVYLWNPSLSAGSVTVRVFTLPLTAGVAQELTTAPLDLGTLGAESARNLKLVEDILTPLGIPTPYVTDGGNLTLEFTIQAADVRGAAQVFSSSFAFGTVPLQVIQ